MKKRDHEKAIFSHFLRVQPLFCGEKIIDWSQPADEKDFPDVICTSKSGLKVGVELGEWLDEDQIRNAKGMDRIQSSILSAIGKQGINDTDNILFVWLLPKPKARIKPCDTNAFRHQLFQCLREHDKRWPRERFWNSPQGHAASGADLEVYPVLAKYLTEVHMFPSMVFRGRPPDGRMVKKEPWSGQDWIIFPARGGAFSEETMLHALFELLADKKEHYGSGSGLAHLSLVVYYNSALLYCSPAEALDFTFENAAAAGRQFLADDPEPFQSIYLFEAVDAGRVFKLC